MFRLWNNNLPEKGVRGWFRAQGQLISGWAIDNAKADRALDIEVFVDGQSIGTARADRYDPLVQAKEGGDGLCAFAFYYADPERDWTEATATAREAKSGTALRTKLPKLEAAGIVGPPLTINTIALPHVRGKIEGYPHLKRMVLELWAKDLRVASDIPIEWVDRNTGLFSARLTEEAISHMVAGPVELALPGLKEAGLAVAVKYEPASAHVHFINNDLTVELPQEYVHSGPLDILLRLVRGSRLVAELQAVAERGVASTAWPQEVPLDGISVEVVIDGIILPSTSCRTRDLAFADSSFEALAAGANSPWSLSEGAAAERGFFAFPDALAEDYRLSGQIVRLSGDPEDGLIRLSQRLSEELRAGDTVRTAVMLRSPKAANFAVRLRDDNGVLNETSRGTRGENVWFPHPMQFELARPVVGELCFEIDARAAELFVALSGAGDRPTLSTGSEPANLLVNGRFDQWPFGTGTRSHSIQGEVCEGWRVTNYKCASPVLSRAVMNPDDSSFGVAVAALQVPDRFSLEGDLARSLPEGRSLQVRFRAGVPLAARHMLSQQVGGIPEFMQISRILIVRRGNILTKDGVALKDEIGAVVAKKVSVGWETREYTFTVPKLQWPVSEQPTVVPRDTSELAEHSYHLVFEFRSAVAVACYDVSVIPVDDRASLAGSTVLSVEDRNIRMQIPGIRTIEHWASPSPVKLRAPAPTAGRDSMKWSLSSGYDPVEIVIPVFNALDETLGCLNSLAGSTSVPILVRLIDDGSDKLVVAALEDHILDKPWITLHSFGRNRGYTYAADFGIRNAGSTWVVLLNSDTVVTRGWLEGMLDCARSDPAIALVGPLSNAATYQSVPDVYDARGKWKINALPAEIDAEHMAEIVRSVSLKDYPEAPLLNGFCTLIKRAVFLDLGGLNYEAFPMGYGEENDLCLRARKSGVRLAVADDVYVFHHKSASFGTERRKELSAKGNAALKQLHPDVDIAALTDWFRDIPALAAVRTGVSDELRRTTATRLRRAQSDGGHASEPRPRRASPAAA